MKELPTVSIIFNGPPSTGKTDLCDALLRHFGDGIVRHQQFKHQLFYAVCEHYGISYSELMLNYTEEKKNIPLEVLENQSPRQAMIFVSENIIKPRYGRDYFGQQAAKSIEEGRINVFSDGGFVEEMKPVYDASDHFLIVQLYRDGCTFEGDSRSYIGTPNLSYGKGNPEDYQYERRIMNTVFPCISYYNNQTFDHMIEFGKALVNFYRGDPYGEV